MPTASNRQTVDPSVEIAPTPIAEALEDLLDTDRQVEQLERWNLRPCELTTPSKTWTPRSATSAGTLYRLLRDSRSTRLSPTARKTALNQLITALDPMVRAIARASNARLPVEDRYQICSLALLQVLSHVKLNQLTRTSRTFTPGRPTPTATLNTYLRVCLKRALYHAEAAQSHAVNIDSTTLRRAFNGTRVSAKQMDRVHGAIASPLSMDGPGRGPNSDDRLSDVLVSELFERPDADLHRQDVNHQLQALIARADLSEREAEVLTLIRGLGTGIEQTPAEVAKQLRCSKGQVSGAHHRALVKLRAVARPA